MFITIMGKMMIIVIIIDDVRISHGDRPLFLKWFILAIE